MVLNQGCEKANSSVAGGSALAEGELFLLRLCAGTLYPESSSVLVPNGWTKHSSAWGWSVQQARVGRAAKSKLNDQQHSTCVVLLLLLPHL
eukprot:5485372-Amphidinium_carterae.2